MQIELKCLKRISNRVTAGNLKFLSCLSICRRTINETNRLSWIVCYIEYWIVSHIEKQLKIVFTLQHRVTIYSKTVARTSLFRNFSFVVCSLVTSHGKKQLISVFFKCLNSSYFRKIFLLRQSFFYSFICKSFCRYVSSLIVCLLFTFLSFTYL